jgi:pimeloyl-ACP methyl ester carboxylesterase
MEWAKEVRPDGEYIVFEEVGNFPHLENSRAFIRIVKEFLS